MSDPRKIIHIDMDAFYTSVEQRDHPEYRGRPVVVGGAPERRGVVAAASYEARKYGIHSAMASQRAVKLCRDLVFLSPRFDAYKAVSMEIREIFHQYTDLVEPLSLDEAYLDVTENRFSNPSATRIAKEIKQKILEKTGLTASAGVSFNMFLAKIASDMNKPDGLTVITPETAEGFIESLAIDKFYGIGHVTAGKMRQMGIQTGADLKRFSELEMLQTFGKSGLFYYRMVRGEDDRPVEPHRVRKSIGAENTFVEDLTEIPELLSQLHPLAEEVVDWMNSREVYGRTVTLKVKYADFQQVTRSKTLESQVADLETLMHLCGELIQTTEAGTRPVRLIGVSLSNLAPREIRETYHQLKLNFA